MFREIKNIEFFDNGKYRRWFQGPQIDLVVWYLDQNFKNIELCEINFDDGLCLRIGGLLGVEFFRVDDGGDNPLKNQSPLLFEENLIKESKKFELLDLVLESTQELDQNIINFIQAKMETT